LGQTEILQQLFRPLRHLKPLTGRPQTSSSRVHCKRTSAASPLRWHQL
jgi:hypothetical protein